MSESRASSDSGDSVQALALSSAGRAPSQQPRSVRIVREYHTHDSHLPLSRRGPLGRTDQPGALYATVSPDQVRPHTISHTRISSTAPGLTPTKHPDIAKPCARGAGAATATPHRERRMSHHRPRRHAAPPLRPAGLTGSNYHEATENPPRARVVHASCLPGHCRALADRIRTRSPRCVLHSASSPVAHVLSQPGHCHAH
jgi:hypothetical protein